MRLVTLASGATAVGVALAAASPALPNTGAPVCDPVTGTITAGLTNWSQPAVLHDATLTVDGAVVVSGPLRFPGPATTLTAPGTYTGAHVVTVRAQRTPTSTPFTSTAEVTCPSPPPADNPPPVYRGPGTPPADNPPPVEPPPAKPKRIDCAFTIAHFSPSVRRAVQKRLGLKCSTPPYRCPVAGAPGKAWQRIIEKRWGVRCPLRNPPPPRNPPAVTGSRTLADQARGILTAVIAATGDRPAGGVAVSGGSTASTARLRMLRDGSSPRQPRPIAGLPAWSCRGSIACTIRRTNAGSILAVRYTAGRNQAGVVVSVRRNPSAR